MAKFLKSIFHPSESRRAISYEGSSEDDRSDPPLDGRRKLSISRSGRMKQAQKKRLSLNMDIYGAEGQNLPTEKPKIVEYHVNTPATRDNTNQRRCSGDSRYSSTESAKILREQENQIHKEQRSFSPVPKSPEDEIDSAFEIIEKP